jgi:hypothetical protein
MAEEGRPEYQRLRPPLQKRERTRFEDLAADGEVVVANVGRLGVWWGSPATTCRGPTAVSVGWAMRPKPPGSNRENTDRGREADVTEPRTTGGTSRRRTTGICAKETAGVDLNRTLRIAIAQCRADVSLAATAADLAIVGRLPFRPHPRPRPGGTVCPRPRPRHCRHLHRE